MKVTLKAYEARMVEDRDVLKRKSVILSTYMKRKGLRRLNASKAEVEKLQDLISKTREELALIHKELDVYKDKAIEAANSLNQEYERRTKSEMEKFTLEAKNQVLEARVNGAASEVAELNGSKEKFNAANLVKYAAPSSKHTIMVRYDPSRFDFIQHAQN
ncbi:hypothetical protein PsorP6_001599 [Peronosclerospora sorghi]|uniref:Uncharacterized protein n=1 Tax=Peronosclerospora sorghi TaxID=230839 RepID=A0ACC0WVT6_9STRA|nr:hypothetical protein PsorP6_001599 [Peronosclerospora sorghi]